MFSLTDVLAATAGRLVGGGDAIFEGVCIDSRSAKPGDLFVAFRGERADGHNFVEDAFRNGAAGALVEALPEGKPWTTAGWRGQPVVLTTNAGHALADLGHYWRRRHAIQVIGVTGSVGKTTTKEAVAGLLSTWFVVHRSAANLNTEIGLPMSLMSIGPNHQVSVLELGMHALGEIRTLARICEPTVGIVTNVHPAHLERLGSLEHIAHAKAELVAELPPDGLAILNADDQRVTDMRRQARCEVTTFGIAGSADIRALNIQSHGLQGVEFDVRYRKQAFHVSMRMMGVHAVYAALPALAAAVHAGVSFHEAAAALAAVAVGPRLVPFAGVNGCTVLDDSYNANPASMYAALDVLATASGQRIAVLGDMLELGFMEEDGHSNVGVHAAATADRLFTIGPRAEMIAAAAIRAGMPQSAVASYRSNAEVAARLAESLGPDDTVLLKGSRAMRLDEIASMLRAAPDK